MEPGQVVEFIDSQKIISAVILEVKNLRLRLLTENNREAKISAGRLAHRSDTRLNPSKGRDKLVAELKQIAIQRRTLSDQVDIQGLWEVLNSEQQWIDLGTMTDFSFPNQTDADHESAVMRAFFNDRLYFKFSPEQFFPHSTEQVESLIHQKEKEQREEQLIDQGSQWLQKILKDRDACAPAEEKEIVKVLASYCLFEKESPHRDIARAMLKRAGMGNPAAIFDFLVKVGQWDPNENLDLLRNNITEQPPAPVQTAVELLFQSPPPVSSQRHDLRDLHLMTIDGPATLDFDDAISLSTEGENFVVGIHISDVGHYITKEDPIDQEALARASSIYTPDRKISMLPAELALDLCSLKADHDRPAISTLITFSAKGKIISSEIVPSIIRVEKQLTYQDVDEIVDTDDTIATLHTIAQRYRNERLDNGAMLIELPEIYIGVNASGTAQVARVERDSAAHLIVAEMMILANDIAARFLSQHNLPAIFRGQAKPRERLFDRDTGSLFQNWMQRKQISRFTLSTTAVPHSGLGLDGYVTCTSPIRKHTDLVTQRQLRAAFGMEEAYTTEQMEFIIAALAEPMGVVGRIQVSRNRYWLLKYLETQIGQKAEAIVLYKRRDCYTILIPDYLIECNLSGANNITLKPEDLIQVTFQHVNARNDIINVYLG